MSRYDVVIVGAGHSGANAAIALRQRGFGGTVALVGDEPELPYERPPLSKDYLLGDRPFQKMLIRPAAFWDEAGVDLLLGRQITSIDHQAHTVTDSAGESIAFSELVWAAGGTPRRLSCPGHDLAGVHAVRSRADVDALLGGLGRAENVVVIGGGYIGLEAAAAITKLGPANVTVLEALDRVLARVAGEPLSRFFEAEHRAHGVDVKLRVAVDRIEGDTNGVTGVQLADGRLLPADIVIVGIGIIPAVQPLIDRGTATPAGVDVDECCRTGLPDVFAIGDCAVRAHEFARGRPVRLESVQNAIDQARTVARAIAGDSQPLPRVVPTFWSDQYDLKLQTIGLSHDYDQVVVRGDPASRRFSVAYLHQGQLIALDCVNNARDFAQGRKLIAAGVRPDPAVLADPHVPLANLQAALPTVTSQSVEPSSVRRPHAQHHPERQ